MTPVRIVLWNKSHKSAIDHQRALVAAEIQPQRCRASGKSEFAALKGSDCPISFDLDRKAFALGTSYLHRFFRFGWDEPSAEKSPA